MEISCLLSKLLHYGFITGSQAFGTAKEDSDIDLVYAIQDSDKINEILGPRTRTQSSYFVGYVVDDEGKAINLIPVHPHEFFPWFLATKAMTATFKESGIIDPIKKYAIFQGIVCLYKGMIDQLGTISEYEKVKRTIIGPLPETESTDAELLF